ncbi:MAG: 50S ribosomal protein L18 [Candidatus Harrisonbacteria bacterium CG10_big_fil_rev_8_21_14_0_10_45_28]|uniref:Large ribosomal subunit protein uL18 n=1 Tax=Candidatus Harrisonbacteria bacterium CG10_big_fil_rev_8_21_14_0_10_45_28 TaxID=1974586 RepID=A0A2H0UNX3_9BACT|nr:MAG: 50S ribosomal protein L18 [Candidatus Harrisonbacteria bacterium CG10_big_fil_rev_8_21_14_0_10_45_28]
MRRAKKLQVKRTMRTKRVRAKIFGTKEKPRMCIFRSNKDIFVQLIDDENGFTLVSASLKEAKAGEGKEMTAGLAKAFSLGKIVGTRAKEAKIESAILDRGKFAYHGRVKALADGAREAGLTI